MVPLLAGLRRFLYAAHVLYWHFLISAALLRFPRPDLIYKRGHHFTGMHGGICGINAFGLWIISLTDLALVFPGKYVLARGLARRITYGDNDCCWYDYADF